jgi:hypothetical protein
MLSKRSAMYAGNTTPLKLTSHKLKINSTLSRSLSNLTVNPSNVKLYSSNSSNGR